MYNFINSYYLVWLLSYCLIAVVVVPAVAPFYFLQIAWSRGIKNALKATWLRVSWWWVQDLSYNACKERKKRSHKLRRKADPSL